MLRSTDSSPGARPVTLALAALLLCAACDGTPAAPTLIGVGPVTSKLVAVQITGEPPDAGESAQLRAVGTFEGGVVADITNAVTWQTSDETVATISPNGLLTGLAAGPIFVTATHHFRRGQRGLLISGPPNYVMFVSELGDPIGLGTAGIRRSFGESSTFNGRTQTFITTQLESGPHIEVVFVMPAGQTLQPGVYEGVGPRLRVTVDGRSCGQRQGRFVIHDSEFHPFNFTLRFHATFEQWCDGRPEGLVGEVNFRR